LKKGHQCRLKELDTFKINFSTQLNRGRDALLSGNHLLALGAVAAGVRAYFAYPMTPSSSLLSYMANIYHETGMLVKTNRRRNFRCPNGNRCNVYGHEDTRGNIWRRL